MSGAGYIHRPLGPSAPSAQAAAPANARLNDLLDFVRQECDAVTSEAHTIKIQNIEYENHAHSQIKDINALRHNFIELQREVEATKAEYEAEILRLRREVDLRSGNQSTPLPSVSSGPSSAHADPREARNHQQLQPLYSLLPPMQSGPTLTSAGPSAPSSAAPALSHLSSSHPSSSFPPHAASSSSSAPSAAAHAPAAASDSNGHHHQANAAPAAPPSTAPASGQWRRDEHDHRSEHPPKRLKIDDGAASQRPTSGPPTPYEHPPLHHAGATPNGAAHQQPAPPPSTSGAASTPVPSAVVNKPSPLPLADRPPHVSARPSTTDTANTPSAHPPAPQLPALASMKPSPSTPQQQQQPLQSPQAQADWAILENPKVQHTLDIELWHTFVHDSVVCCVKFSPDAKYLAAGCNRNTYLYNAHTGQRECVLVDTQTGKDDNYIRSACFTPDGSKLATGSEDRKIRIWDLSTRSIHQVFEGHKNEIYSLVFSPDGSLLYSGSGDSSVRVWDMESGTCKSTLVIEDQLVGDNGQQVDAGVTSVALSPDGKILAAGSLDTHVRIWDAQSGARLDKLKGHKDSVYSVVFAPDASWLVSGSLDKTLKIWDLKNIYTTLSKSSSAASAPAQDGQTSDSAPAKVEDSPTSATGAVVPATAAGGELKTPCVTTLCGHKDYVLSVAVPPSGKWIVSGSKDRGVSFWDPKVALANVVLQGHKNSVISIATSDVDNLLATGSGDWTCRIWKYKPAESQE